jgi:hypothetical protein
MRSHGGWSLERRSARALLLALSLGTSRVAHADEVDRCLAAHPAAQRLRQDGKLRASRAELLVCARAVCPGVVRSECGRWLSEVDELTPSIVVSAREARGGDVTNARVIADGETAAQRLDGREIALDPGAHTIRVQASGYEPSDLEVVLHERERARPLAFTMKSTVVEPAPRPTTPLRTDATPSSSGPEARPVPASVYVLGAIGVVALGSFTWFGLSGRSEYFDLKDSCGPGCSQSDVGSMRTKLIVADVSLGVSVVALGAAAYLLLTRPAH